MLASCSNYADATWLQGYTGLRCSKFKVASSVIMAKRVRDDV